MKSSILKSLFTSLFIWGATLLVSSCSSSDGTDKYLSYPIPEQGFTELKYSPSRTTFQVWAPTAQEARVLLYQDGETGHTDKMFTLDQDPSTGVWSIDINRDLMGYYYTFNVKINDIWQGDTPGIMAKAVGVNGKRAVILDWKITNPEGWEADTSPSLLSTTDILMYQLHIGNFTKSKTSNVEVSKAGKYLGVIEPNLVLSDSLTTVGLDHLKELGVTHIRLMPVFDFINKDEAIEDEANFTWGYDPLNYNTLEGIYATNPKDPFSRIRDFKKLVQGLHQAGFRVIMDVSYVYGNTSNSNFQKTVPGYFFRQAKEDEILVGENQKGEIASHRPAVVQFMIESMKHWMQEYHIDGFCLDQLDLYDPEALVAIESALKQAKPSVLLLGNSTNKTVRMAETKKNGVSEFMQTYSKALRSLDSDSLNCGYLMRDVAYATAIKSGFVGGVDHPAINKDSLESFWTHFVSRPDLSFNFVSSSNEGYLADYLNSEVSDAYNQEQSRLSKLAYTYLFTSQGIPTIYEGEEFMSSRGDISSNEARKKQSTFSINWNDKLKYKDHFQYVKSLIQLRKNHPAFRLKSAEDVRKHVEFLPTENPLVIAYRIKENANGDDWEDILVILNPLREAVRVDIPEGRYIVVCRDGQINELGLNYSYGQAYVSGQSAMVLFRSDKQVYIPQPIVEEPEVEVNIDKLIKRPEFDFKPQPVTQEKVDVPDKIKDIRIK